MDDTAHFPAVRLRHLNRSSRKRACDRHRIRAKIKSKCLFEANIVGRQKVPCFRFCRNTCPRNQNLYERHLSWERIWLLVRFSCSLSRGYGGPYPLPSRCIHPRRSPKPWNMRRLRSNPISPGGKNAVSNTIFKPVCRNIDGNSKESHRPMKSPGRCWRLRRIRNHVGTGMPSVRPEFEAS